MARKVVLAGACRTAIGVMGGTLSKTPAPDLGTVVIKEALKRTGIKPEQVDEVYMGCVIQAGLGQNPARQAAVNAGIPVEVPATTINVLCGSGMHCVNLAAKLIASGDADIIVAGGMENMSMAPYLLYNARFGYRMGAGKMDDALIRDALTDAFGGYHMGITAENIAEDWGLTREQLDEFAAWSQQKAQKAIAEGKFKDEIVPMEVKQKKQTVVFDTDEGPRPNVTAESISKLMKKALKNDKITVKVEKLKNKKISSMITLSEESRRMQDMMKMYSMPGMDMSAFGGEGETLILNANHPLVQYITEHQDGENAEMICEQLYDLAKLQHAPLSADAMTKFVARSNDIMMLLTK